METEKWIKIYILCSTICGTAAYVQGFEAETKGQKWKEVLYIVLIFLFHFFALFALTELHYKEKEKEVNK